MGVIDRSYRRLDEWTRALSRGGYAALVGLVSAVVLFVIGVLLGESLTVDAVAMGLSMSVVYYVLDPQ